MYLKYLPKRTHFGYGVMVHASMLAALDHNNNANREQVGELSLFLSFVPLDMNYPIIKYWVSIHYQLKLIVIAIVTTLPL